jgi:hypothetical protein
MPLGPAPTTMVSAAVLAAVSIGVTMPDRDWPSRQEFASRGKQGLADTQN